MHTAHSILLAALLGLASCGGDGDSPGGRSPSGAGTAETPVEVMGEPVESLSTRETFRARLHPVGGPIPLNEPFAVEVELLGPDGETPLEGFDAVTLDARMPEHGHGMTRDVELHQVAPGRYRAEGLLFHMIGHWAIHVDVASGARIERAQLDVELEL